MDVHFLSAYTQLVGISIVQILTYQFLQLTVHTILLVAVLTVLVDVPHIILLFNAMALLVLFLTIFGDSILTLIKRLHLIDSSLHPSGLLYHQGRA